MQNYYKYVRYGTVPVIQEPVPVPTGTLMKNSVFILFFPKQVQIINEQGSDPDPPN